MPKIKVGNTFLENISNENSESPLFSSDKFAHGELLTIDPKLKADNEPQINYKHPNGKLWLGDSFQWLESLEDESVDLIFADPPYSIGKADWDHFESHDEYVDWTIKWIEISSQKLKTTGSLYVCGFSEILADIRRPSSPFFYKCKWLVWIYKNKANLSNDWGRSHESILHFRKGKKVTFNADDVRIPYGDHTLKYPEHPQATSSQYRHNSQKKRDHWKPHPEGAKPKDFFEIPVTNNGMKEKTPHPTQKPEELLRRIILASSNEEDLVIDPFSGSGTTLVCAEQLNRKWEGCDINEEYNSWAVLRLENLQHRSIQEWKEFDRENTRRRSSIR